MPNTDTPKIRLSYNINGQQVWHGEWFEVSRKSSYYHHLTVLDNREKGGLTECAVEYIVDGIITTSIDSLPPHLKKEVRDGVISAREVWDLTSSEGLYYAVRYRTKYD